MLKLNSNAGGSVSLTVDDTLTTDEEVVVQDPIGVNQTWQDVETSRAFDTDYVNDTGRPIMVCVGFMNGVNSYCSFLVDGNSLGQTGVITGGSPTMNILIPNGSTYRFQMDDGTAGAISIWVELR